MILTWDIVDGASAYRVRWRTTDTYQVTDKYDTKVTQYDPNATVALPKGVIIFFKVCVLIAPDTEGEYSNEVALIPAPTNLRWI